MFFRRALRRAHGLKRVKHQGGKFMEKRGIVSYALVFLAIATLAVSIFGTASVLNANDELSKLPAAAKASPVRMAEPTVENAKIRLIVPQKEVAK